MLRLLGKTVFKIAGWSYDDVPDYWHKKQVIIGFPHTSNMDTIMAFCYNCIIKANAKVLIKSNWFFWPMSSIIRPLGGIPVVRDKESGFVGNVIEAFNQRNHFILAMVPEGTRKKTQRIKTGFWNIAKGAKTPIICWFFDRPNKRIRWIGYIMPGEDIVEDLVKIAAIYRQHGYAIPLGDLEQYTSNSPKSDPSNR